MNTRTFRPVLSSKARLRFDRTRGQALLLYPERGLLLNDTAAKILQHCAGKETIAEIIETLMKDYPQTSAEMLTEQVCAFLQEMHALRLLELRT